jgi:hypothetical protein
MVFVLSMLEEAPKGALTINATSRSSTQWSTGLSPFFLGPVPLYGGQIAQNVENGWQYTKVYKEHIDQNLNPTPQYFEWAREGWANHRAVRYPMGKGARPEYSYWDGLKLGYIEARKKIYIPLYAYAVAKSQAYQKLKEIYAKQDVYLRDFDGYNHRKLNMSYEEVINNPKRKMGHAFVLAMLLELGRDIKKLL